MGTSAPRVPNMINYIFSTHLQLSNGKLARNKVLCQWLSEGYCDHSTVIKAHCVMVITTALGSWISRFFIIHFVNVSDLVDI
jgi:hypothetical protein